MPPAAVPTAALLYWRTSRGLSQGQLARLAGVAPTSVWRGEHGWPLQPRTVAQLAEVLQVEPADLLAQPPES